MSQQKYTPKVKYDDQNRRIGSITGILLDDTNIKISRRGGLTRNRMPSPDMWEMKQLKGGQALHLIDGLNKPRNLEDEEDDEEDDLAEEYAELELNEEEAPFLKGQTTKAGMCLDPIKISNVPDGALQQAAMKQQSLAKDRRVTGFSAYQHLKPPR